MTYYVSSGTLNLTKPKPKPKVVLIPTALPPSVSDRYFAQILRLRSIVNSD